jgi:glycosyltransferase involved in cell wall biosynthesis
MSRRVVILEPDLDGHHAFWLALLIEAHRREGWAVEVVTAADWSRLRAQAELRGFALDAGAGVRMHVAPATGETGGGETRWLAQARKIAAETGAERIFVAFLDRFWAAILAEAASGAGEDGGVREAGAAKLAGIWFHPHALDAKWRWAPPLGKRWATRGRVHRFIGSEAAARRFAMIYFTVEEARLQMAGLNPGVGAWVLPDPYEREPRLSREEARCHLKLPEGRMIFLHLGSAERRKGLPDVLAAFERLRSRSGAAIGRAPLLLRVGPNGRLKRSEQASLEALKSAGMAEVVDAFVPAEDLMEYFAATDWVLIPYRKFRYSSGVLANAVGAGRPVVAADYGEIGRQVARDGLGLVYRHGSVAALAEALAKAAGEGARAVAPAQVASRTTEAFMAAVAETVR